MRPVPWFWLIRFALSTAVAVIWGTMYPNTKVWQLFLVALSSIALMEVFRYGYQREQASVRRKNERKQL